MLTCIAVGLGVGEIILIVACAAVVIGVVVAAIVRKRKGADSCCDECGSCPHCHRCADKNNSEKIK